MGPVELMIAASSDCSGLTLVQSLVICDVLRLRCRNGNRGNQMKMTGMILGIIGGILGLIVGFVGFGAASVGNALASAAGTNDSFVIYQVFGIAAPIASLVGGGLSTSKPQIGMILMAASAVIMALVFGIGMFTIFPIALSGVGALLVFLDGNQAKSPAA